MGVQGFFELFFGFIRNIFGTLNQYKLYAFGAEVSIVAIIFALIVTSMVISIFWKGAKG